MNGLLLPLIVDDERGAVRSAAARCWLHAEVQAIVTARVLITEYD